MAEKAFRKKLSSAKFIARVIDDGRVTIPEEIRKLLGIRTGDYVSCDVESILSPVDQTPLIQTHKRE